MTLTISREGQVTLPREALDHFGVAPGEQIALNLLPDGRGTLHREADREARFDRVLGMIKTDKQVSTCEMNEVIAKGWAGLLDDDDDD